MSGSDIIFPEYVAHDVTALVSFSASSKWLLEASPRRFFPFRVENDVLFSDWSTLDVPVYYHWKSHFDVDIKTNPARKVENCKMPPKKDTKDKGKAAGGGAKGGKGAAPPKGGKGAVPGEFSLALLNPGETH